MPRQPNILVFMTDQQHYDTIAANSPAAMRHVQKLAARGLTFERAYTPCPQCTPARASAVTGLYPHRHGLIVNSHSPINQRDAMLPGIATMGDVFGKAGYRAAYAGKWHVGNTSPEQHGFELASGPRRRRPMKTWDESMPIAEVKREAPLAATSDQPLEDTQPFMVADNVVKFIEEHHARPAAQPFFMFASCTPPHVPWVVPEPYASMVDPGSLVEPTSYSDDLTDKPESYRHHTGINFCNVGGNWPEFARAKAKYFGYCRLIDDAFGQVLDALDRLKLTDDTLVVFTSDHGELLGAHGLAGKNELACEELIRIPMVMAGPDVEPGATRATMTLCDLFATFMAAAGVEGEAPADSRDVSALFSCAGRQAAEAQPNEPVIIEHHGTTHPNAIRAIRTDKWKYTYRPHEIDELYDVENDPDERRNVVDDPSLADTLRELRFELMHWMRQREDFLYNGAATVFVKMYGREAVLGAAAVAP